jgi:hypothetical protein
MTLIVALVNQDQTLQVSDRRLSYFGARPPDDESDKAIYYKTGNGRFAVGYTGLAAAGSFRTHPWLVEQLGEVSKPEYLAGAALPRLRDRLDQVFKEKRVLRNLSRVQRRLTVVFSGFLDVGGTPRGANAVLSNFQDAKTGLDVPEAKDEFRLDLLADGGMTKGTFPLIRAFGAQGAITADELAGLEGMLRTRQPQQAILARTIAVIRAAATRPEARGTVGKSLSSITLPVDADGPTMAFHAATSDRMIPAPAAVIATPAVKVGIKSLEFRRADEHLSPPEGTPIPGRNDPCWCGSGRKFKQCHGASAGARGTS